MWKRGARGSFPYATKPYATIGGPACGPASDAISLARHRAGAAAVWYNGWWAPVVVAGATVGVTAGAIIASSSAANCWQNRPVYDAYGRWLGNRTINVCR